MGQTNFYGKNYNDCWPPVTVREISNPNSEYWRSECYLSRRQFDKLPISQVEWQQFEDLFHAWRPDEHTWKECDQVYTQACKLYQPGISMSDLALQCGVKND